MLLSQSYTFLKEEMQNKLDEKNRKTSTMQPKLFEASSLCFQHKDRKTAELCPSEDTNERDDLQFSTNLADSNFLQSPALANAYSFSNPIQAPSPSRCNHITEVQPIVHNATQAQSLDSDTLLKNSSFSVKNVDSHWYSDKSPHYHETPNNIADALPNLHATKLFLDLQKDSTRKRTQEDRSHMTTSSTAAPVLTTSTTENNESSSNEFYDLGNFQQARDPTKPTLRTSEEKKFTNSKNVDDSLTGDFVIQTEQVHNKVNLGAKSRPFLRKGARNRRSNMNKEPKKTYQYYSNAVSKTFATVDSPLDSTFQTISLDHDSKRSTFSLKPLCQKDEAENEVEAMCHLATETFLRWDKNIAKVPVLNTDAPLQSSDKNDTQLNSSRDLEILRVQAQAKMALVEEKLIRIKEFQNTLETKKENFLKEKQNFLLDQERQRIDFHAEREELLADIEKKRDFLKKEKNKIFTQIESFELLIKEKSVLESQIQKLSRQIKEQEEDFRNKETRYRNIIDRLNCKVRMLESKVSVLQQTAEKHAKLQKESQISHNSNPHKVFRGQDVTLLSSSNHRDGDKRTLRKDPHLPYRLSRSTPIPLTNKHHETESDMVSTVSRYSTEHQLELNASKCQENKEKFQDRLSNFKRLLEFDFKKKWSSFDESLALLGKPLALTLREPPIKRTNGMQHFLYNDGHTEIVFSNGIRKVTLPNGWVFTFFTNGDIRGVNCEGVLYYYYYNDSIYTITEADGTLFNYFPNQQLDCIYPDKTIQVRYPNQILKQIDAKGVEYIEKIQSDIVF